MSAKRIYWAVWSLSLSLTAVGPALAEDVRATLAPVSPGTHAPAAVHERMAPCDGEDIFYNHDGGYDGVNGLVSQRNGSTDAWTVDKIRLLGPAHIRDVHWWTIEAFYTWYGTADVQVWGVNPNTGGPDDGNVIASVVGVPNTRIDTGNVLFGFPVFQYDITGLDISLPPGTFYFGVRPVGASGYSYWATSGPGTVDNQSWFIGPAFGVPNWIPGSDPLAYGTPEHQAFCLGGSCVCCFSARCGDACCFDAIGECQDDFDPIACLQAGGRYAMDTLCADMQPPCGQLPGACCYDNDYCNQVTATLCGNLLGDANCNGVIDFDDINAFVANLGQEVVPPCAGIGNSDTNQDGLITFDDINSFVEILSTQAQIHGTWLGAGTPCSACPCIVPCPPGSSSENEVCAIPGPGADTTNGGCNSSPFAFGSISVGETICGTSAFTADFNYRDTDWFTIQGLTGANIFTVTAEAEFDLQLYFITDTGADCVGFTAISATAGPCSVATIVTFGLSLDTYYVFVGPQFTSYFECTDGNPQYWVHLECTPVASGACCRHGICYDGYTADACWEFGGQYQGDNLLCADITCPPPPCPECYCPRIIPGLPYNDADNTCGYVLDCPASCGANNAPDVVYKWTSTYNALVTATTCYGSSFDTVIHVQTSCCGGDVVCNDDYEPCGLQSLVQWYATAGQDYYIIVTGYSTNCGAYTLTLPVCCE